MICKEFENWVLTKKIEDPAGKPAALDHKKNCPSCSRLYDIDHAAEETICDAFQQIGIPNGLYDQVENSINWFDQLTQKKHEKKSKSKLAVAAVFFLFVITAISYTLNSPFQYNNLQELSESAVARHLQGSADLEYTADAMDSALVQMSKALSFNVILPDLSSLDLSGPNPPGPDYTLLGGRICALGKCKIAYLVYRRQEKICSVFILDYDNLGFNMADGSRFNNEIKGLHTRIWKDRGQVYAMVY